MSSVSHWRTARLLVMPIAGAIALAAGSFGNQACLTRACEGGVVEVYGRGNLIDDNTWQSSGTQDEWVAFPHSSTIKLGHPLGRSPTEVLVWISAEKKQEIEGANFTIAGGDVAKISYVNDATINVANGTCADFYMRVVLRAAPRPAPSPVDAGSEAGSNEGGTSEGGADASGLDASTGDAGSD